MVKKMGVQSVEISQPTENKSSAREKYSNFFSAAKKLCTNLQQILYLQYISPSLRGARVLI
jgi:hypothetical protein